MPGQAMGLVGVSGCGKSTLARVLLGLETRTAGEVLLGCKEIGAVETRDCDTETVSSIQMVFQNPFDTLNPSHTVGAQIIRSLEKFGVGASQAERRETMQELLDFVKLPREFEGRMPRQLSAGQKQRIGIARAFAGHPKLVVADEHLESMEPVISLAS
jgi:peptide/nickel transport system ATP-binding protein